ncbi:MAG: hypothetical protein MJ219_01000 [Mycoplasmoidaceae bacterium]|nr:hypothetical protein [Mycoplasmoidaceae bacterium]
MANTIIKKIGDVQLISFATPNTEVNNKIPKEAEVVFTSSQKNVKKITQDLFKEFKKTYKPEKNMSIVVKAVRGSYKCIKKLEDSKHIIDFIDECPYGPLS